MWQWLPQSVGLAVWGLIHPFLGREGLHIIGQGPVMHRAVLTGHISSLGVEVGHCVLHPVGIVALGEVVAGVGSSTLLALQAGLDLKNGNCRCQ